MSEVQPPTRDSRDMLAATMMHLRNFEGRFNLDKSGFHKELYGHETDHAREMILRQEPRTVKRPGSGVSLPYEVRLEMALQLDDHQCALTVAGHQYQKHHVLSEGAEGIPHLHTLWAEHMEKSFSQAELLSERVAQLGGVPTANPVTKHELSYIKCEPEGRYSVRDFARNDLEHELKIQQMLRKTIERAHELRDFGTAELLEQVLLDREDLGFHLYSNLEDDTLVRGMTHLLDGEYDRAGNRPMPPDSKLQ